MAPPIKYAANFVSTMYQRAGTPSEVAINPANRSAATLNSIRATLDGAGVAFAGRAYPLAIERYKTARGLCYQLLNPSHRLSHFALVDALMHPVGKEIESGMATAGLRLIEGLQPDVTPFSAPVVVAGVEGSSDDKRLTGLGFQLGAAGMADQVTLGTTLLAKGQAAEAATVLASAVELQRDGTADHSLHGTALLNLSIAQLAQGEASAAVETAALANEQFAAANDLLGQAQSLHAGGVALQRAGQADESKHLLDKASQQFGLATDHIRVAPAVVAPGRIVDHLNPVLARPQLVQRPVLRRFDTGVLRGLDTGVLGTGLHVSDAALAVPAVIGPSREVPAAALPSDDVNTLSFIAQRDVSRLALRWPAAEQGFSSVQVDTLDTPVARRNAWQVGIPVGRDVKSVQWEIAKAPVAGDLIKSAYQPRIDTAIIGDLVWWPDSEATTAAYLAHIYSYVIPVGLGDCYQESGDYERAEQYYLQAANYTYLNKALEAPSLWVKLATNVLRWGDSYYRREDTATAKAVYAKLARQDGTADPTAPLYGLAAFADVATQASTVLADTAHIPDTVNPAVANLVLTVLARWQYITGGLDFYGLTFTPLFTFDYLQEAARAFTQQAIQAEREYINFQVQAEAEAASRRDLESSLAMASIEASAQAQLAAAAQSDANAAAAAVALATLRTTNAGEDLEAYEDAGYWQYISQSIATAHGAHEDWYEGEIRGLAHDMEQGSWHGNAGKLAAAATLLGGQKSYEYQLGRMRNQIEEMAATIPIAQAQANAANSRLAAANLQALAARQRVAMVADALAAFENEVFTPELWARMALLMRDISGSYQYWAIGAAKLMQRAYNFENDTDLDVIRPEYSVPSTGDLLGSDLLLRDIDSFSYHLLANTTKKESQLKDVVSLRNEYPFAFRDFLRTGRMTFETSLYDFARRHPGFYGQRIAAVELQVIGLLPPEGVRGTLSAGLVSRYALIDGSQKQRVHSLETLALSEYALRGDAYVFRTDPRKLGLFEGHGVATTWELDLPRGSNNLDYRLITDIQLVIYYSARYSQPLRDAVVQAPLQPGEDIHVRDFAMRFDLPEVWYQFLRTKQATWTFDPAYLPRNEENFKLSSLALSLIAPDGTALDGVPVTLTLPGQAPVTMDTDATGAVSAEAGNALAGAMGGDLLGEWTLALDPAAGHPLLNAQGSLDPSVLSNIALIVQYTFAYRA